MTMATFQIQASLQIGKGLLYCTFFSSDSAKGPLKSSLLFNFSFSSKVLVITSLIHSSNTKCVLCNGHVMINHIKRLLY